MRPGLCDSCLAYLAAGPSSHFMVPAAVELIKWCLCNMIFCRLHGGLFRAPPKATSGKRKRTSGKGSGGGDLHSWFVCLPHHAAAWSPACCPYGLVLVGVVGVAVFSSSNSIVLLPLALGNAVCNALALAVGWLRTRIVLLMPAVPRKSCTGYIP